MTPTDYWDDGPTLDDGLGRGTVRPAPLPKLAPGWERVATLSGCTNRVGIDNVFSKACNRSTAYANSKTSERSCIECADELGVFPEAGGDGGVSS